jgi:hypothetical protein
LIQRWVIILPNDGPIEAPDRRGSRLKKIVPSAIWLDALQTNERAISYLITELGSHAAQQPRSRAFGAPDETKLVESPDRLSARRYGTRKSRV